MVNPAEINPDGGTWEECMRRDLAQLVTCDHVATLPGWDKSQGAQLEVYIADRLGITVVNTHDLPAMEIAG
ncbi:DUF4406 domain-containing protein [Pseudomonas quasicaspiana]|uniref:DUF4406 domain-containing protein n=1 Tax=Pseudomonas quasicaspiana TaxID=2829821 RepID=UPI001E2924A0|nr:DUF4406 domain-containing protein [Pseudomonas quasicaspiana]